MTHSTQATRTSPMRPASATVIGTPTLMTSKAITPNGHGRHDVPAQIDDA